MKDLSREEKAILATIVYFDIFSYPLTAFEVYKYLLSPQGDPLDAELFQIKRLLETSATLQKKIQTRQGFYFLRGKENSVSLRKTRYKIAEKKFKKARKLFFLLSKIPFIQMICVCNTLAYSNSREESDIDLAIFCRPKTLWLTRLLAVSAMELLGQRPTDDDFKNKICMSFFLSEDSLSLEKYQSEKTDIHFIYWQAQFYPIFIRKNICFTFHNRWVKKYLPNHLASPISDRRTIKTTAENKIRSTLKTSRHRSAMEAVAKKYQLNILPPKLKAAADEPTTDVILQDDIIKMHSNDRRLEYNRKFKLRYESILKYYEETAKNN
ncbi:MAG TPA: hypothetical protein VMX18_04225 [Candidatus Bipolaricaulota bacterium]|nr:hypothetical protein [Candidatus Bipolaricaulota bacterium]